MNKPKPELINAFLAWLSSAPHAEREDHYADEVTLEHLGGLSRKEFIDFFTQFVHDGGYVQSGGNRSSSRFKKTIQSKYKEFREFALEPFIQQFDELEWLTRINNFAHFGIGIATIYLNRVKKIKYAICNDKAVKAVKLFGIRVPTKHAKRYEAVRDAWKQLKEWYPKIDNYFKADALSQFLIGEPAGKRWRAELEGSTEPVIADPIIKPRYWLYAPGPNAKFWDECLSNGIMVYGADQLTDLLEYKTVQDIQKAIQQNRKSHRLPTNNARTCWMFSREINVGDIIIVKKGTQQYLGYGVVTGPYEHDRSRETYRNIRTVEWRKHGEWPKDKEDKIPSTTLTEITKKPDFVARLKRLMDIQESTASKPLNIILYGPPGTGKTYTLRNEYMSRFADPGASTPRYDFVTFHQSYSYEDFVEGIKPVLSRNVEDSLRYEIKPGIFKTMVQRALADPDHEFAILIDEISRGNVANIFGELITLIEEDKRKGKANELSAMLPYSGDLFVVPPNLHIIGAMNTADRSVEALDTALRRRFMFIAFRPKPEMIEQPAGLAVDLQKLLTIINLRIERLLDKDHCIGHSYFMGLIDCSNPLDGLREVFANKIIPLLEEYFYGEPGKIGMILGERFVERTDNEENMMDGDWDADEFEKRPIFVIKESKDLTEADFRTVYE